MKKYSIYTEVKEPYFNFYELLGFPVLPICIIAFVSYLIVFFFGLVVMLVTNAILAALLAFYYNGLKNASPNGSRNSTSSMSGFAILQTALLPFIVIFGVILISNVGGYVIAEFQHTGVFYATYFYIWLFVMLALPVMYFVTIQLKYKFKLYYNAYYFTPLHLNVVCDYELLTSSEEITFLQTKKQLMSTVAVKQPYQEEYITQLSKLSVKERNDCLYKPVFNETVYIPKGTDQLKLSWYSVIEDRYYEDEIAFPFDKLEYIENKYPLNVSRFLRGEKTDRVTLCLQQGGTIKLFNKHQNLMEGIVPFVDIDEKKRVEFKDTLQFQYRAQNVAALANSIRHSNAISKRAVLMDFMCSWQITGEQLDIHNVEIKDVQNNYVTSDPIAINTFELRRLPIFFEIDYRKTTWLHIHIDAEKLYDLIHMYFDKEPALTFNLNLDLEKGEASLLIKNGETVVPFTAWEKEIFSSRWVDAKDSFLEHKAYYIQNDILKEIHTYITQREYAKAEMLCEEALKRYPYFPIIYFYKARLFFYNNGSEASYLQKEYFIDKTKTEPYALAHMYNHYGCLYDEDKRYDESLICFQKAHEIYPKELIYLANIAEIYYKLKDSERAFYYAQECVKKEFTSDMVAEIILNKGVIYNPSRRGGS